MDKNLSQITFHDIAEASAILKNIAHFTPVFTSRQANQKANAQIFFKCENFQRGGAFKIRGAYFAINKLTAAERKRGIIAFSAGNHGQAVALAAAILGTKAIIVMPSDAPKVKIEATKAYGANVILFDKVLERREIITSQLIDEHGYILIPPFDNGNIIAGQGTVAKEFFEEVGELDYLFVPVGGGGLLAGCAIAASVLSPNCKIIGVEPELGNDAQQSFRKKEIISISIPNTIADGARTQAIGFTVLPILLEHVHDIMTVTDEMLFEQMLFFAERMKMIVEPTGCLGAAAVLNKLVKFNGAKVGVIVSGGNVDLEMFGKVK